jgi:hypothetical protein
LRAVRNVCGTGGTFAFWPLLQHAPAEKQQDVFWICDLVDKLLSEALHVDGRIPRVLDLTRNVNKYIYIYLKKNIDHCSDLQADKRKHFAAARIGFSNHCFHLVRVVVNISQVKNHDPKTLSARIFSMTSGWSAIPGTLASSISAMMNGRTVVSGNLVMWNFLLCTCSNPTCLHALVLVAKLHKKRKGSG